MTNKKPVIFCDQDIPYLSAWLQGSCDLIHYCAGELSPANLVAADGLIVRSVTSVDAALIRQSSCCWIGSVTAGINHLDIESLERSKVAWNYAPGANAPAVCEYVLSALYLAQITGVLSAQSRVGVIGVGEVGSRVVAACEQRGWQACCYDPPKAAREASFVSVSWDELLQCDFAIVCAAYTRSGRWPTHQLLDANALQAWSGLRGLINAARGEIVDYEALFLSPGPSGQAGGRRGEGASRESLPPTSRESLPPTSRESLLPTSRGLSAGSSRLWACLDVWPNEPTVDPRWIAQATIATPHIAGYSKQSKWRLSAMVYQACCQFFELPMQAIAQPATNESNKTWHDSVGLTELSKQMKKHYAEQSSAQLFHRLRKQYPLRD